jgi:hypothetical protein
MAEHVRGLLEVVGRRNGWILSAHAGLPSPDSTQPLLRTAEWGLDGVRDDIRAYALSFLSEPGGLPADGGRPGTPVLLRSHRDRKIPATMRPGLEVRRRFRDGRVYLMDSPDDVSVIVNGGTGNLHGTMFPGMSNLLPVTRSLDASTWVH